MNIQLQKSSALSAKRLMVSAVIAVLAISGVLLYGKNTDQDSVYKGFEWDSYRLKEDLWWNSPDCSSIADDIIKCQKPAGGRAYELPFICTRESVGIVQLMKSLRNPPTEVQTSIQSAIEWFDEVKLEGFRFEWVGDDRQLAAGGPDDLLWARYYCLDGSPPLFADRDGKAYDSVSEISKERRTGYDWYGTWPLELVE